MPEETIVAPVIEEKKTEAKSEETPKVYDAAHVQRLRDEAKQYRLERDTASKERDDLAKYKSDKEAADLAAEKKWQELAEKTKQEAEQQTKAAEEKVEKAIKSVILAEAKAAAIKEGIRDIEDVKLLDLSSVTVEDGEVVGLESVITAAKEKKPHWFGAEVKKVVKPGSPPSGSGGDTPPKDSRQLNDTDFAAQKLKMGLIRNF